MAGLLDFGFTQYGRNTSLPSGIDAGSKAPGPMFSLGGLPSSGGMSTMYIEGRNTELRTNGFISKPFRCLPPPWSSPLTAIEDNLDHQSIAFCRIAVETLQENMLNGGPFLHDSGSVNVGIAALNYYLKSEAGRREYGAETDCVKFRKDWRFLGGCVTNPQEKDSHGRTERVMTFVTGKRFRCKNIWALHKGHKLVVGDHLFVVMERKSLDSFYVDVKQKKQQLPRWDAQFESKGSAPSTYWQAVPCIGRFDKLHSSAYIKTQTVLHSDGKGGTVSEQELVVGWPIHIGTVRDVLDTKNETEDRFAELAREAVFRESPDPEVHRKSHAALHDLELQIRVHM